MVEYDSKGGVTKCHLLKFMLKLMSEKKFLWSVVELFIYKHTLFIHCESKKQDTILVSVTLPNINRFSKFFHC